jgi:hypothetical protein
MLSFQLPSVLSAVRQPVPFRSADKVHRSELICRSSSRVDQRALPVSISKKQPLMGPAQFATHCVANLKIHEKRPHMLEIGAIESFSPIPL